MKGRGFLFYLLLISIAEVTAVSRDDFPADFIFGAGSSAYQVEGAAAEDGRKPSIWDTFAHAGRTADTNTGDIAADQYHKYKEDVKLMHEMGLDAYRFSISWSRLIPDGRGEVNPKGLQYYNNLINELAIYGIEAHVTLYHFDLPQALEDEYAGLVSPKIVKDFTAYADVCFKEFGDRVKYWITFNEPNVEALLGYDVGIFPPARCSYPFGSNCSKGDSTTEPYISAHNILLSHASAASLYREKYQEEQGGFIGITILGYWFEPFTESPQDAVAVKRIIEFHIGWFLDPLVYGTYPAIMRTIVGSRLPSFAVEESKQLKGSYDFISLNHYGMYYLQAGPKGFDKNERDYIEDAFSASFTLTSYGEPIIPSRLFVKDFIGSRITPTNSTPWALQSLLEYIKLHYQNPAIIIHENGYGEFDIDPTASRNDDAADDDYRVNYLKGYIESMLLSIRNGSNTQGYFVWSFIDCLELSYGYTSRYGLYGVDFNRSDRKRYPRFSAQWYSKFLQSSGPKRGTSSNVYIE